MYIQDFVSIVVHISAKKNINYSKVWKALSEKSLIITQLTLFPIIGHGMLSE
ncbi:MAG: hypothetical protein PWQ79_1499 [Thermococcaceae archaeon]|nr:hypothetical protein [Thermococcaceae archaeon]MDK2914584.1 hypothetical protein [Thermococcaceae archaeon]